MERNEETEKGLKATSSSNLILVERNEETEKGLKGIEETEKRLKATSSSNFDEVWLLFFIVSVNEEEPANKKKI